MGATQSKRQRHRDAKALRKAVVQADLERIRAIAERAPAALTQKSFFTRRTLLMVAVRGRRTPRSTARVTNTLVVSTLLWAAEENLGSCDAYNQFLNGKDIFGNTALHLSCKVRAISSSTVVRMLVEEGASPLLFNRRGNTCLHVAVAFCNAGCIDVILESRIGGTSAAQATVRDRIGDVPFVDATNNSGLTALHIAALTAHPASVAALVEHGAQMDCGVARGIENVPYLCGGSTPLHIAASLGDVRSVMILLQAQYRVPGLELRRIRNLVGLTPVNCALLMGYHSVVRILVDTPRRDPNTGGLSLSQRHGNTRQHSQRQNVEFTANLREQMTSVLHKATLLVTLRDIACYWKSQGIRDQRSTCDALDGIQLSTLSQFKITEMRQLLENEEASLRDILFGFEQVLYGGNPDKDNPRRVPISLKAQNELEDECCLCLDHQTEVQFDCSHKACFECTARLCIRQQVGDVTCPFCRCPITGIAAIELNTSSMNVCPPPSPNRAPSCVDDMTITGL